MKENKFIVPMVFLAFMFFTCGFALGINSLLVPVLKVSLSVSSMEAYMLIGATFLPFLIFGYPAGLLISKIGYKRTMASAFAMFAIAFGVFILSAEAKSFVIFLLASFICGMANTFLQAAINPYVTILGPTESAAKRISIMGMINKLAWPVSPLFIALFASSGGSVGLEDLNKPFLVIIGLFIILGIVALVSPLPEVKAAGEDNDTADTEVSSYANSKSSVFQFPHLVLGAIAIFFYVGSETIVLGTLIDYAQELSLPHPETYSWITPISISIGYILGIILIPKYLSQTKALQICSFVALVGTALVVVLPGVYSIYSVGIMALGCSLMWPAFWPLALMDLGKYTKQGSSLLTMGLIGGAVITVLFGLIKDISDIRYAYSICFISFIYILFYAFKGHKLR
ncbi:MAG: MFS transporter [Porphyromonadaceae bacterium]|jgi:glucose/galactose transporter|uniref:MFS transporter n=1 Tax=unclassified Porphyromonas TaxID=2645799 RepID=UPI0004D4E9A9|nr:MULTISPECIES: MFS transporter [unclassified Porphyromonas]KDU78598.1 transporter, major facilitator family protein [Porphyromonas sp. KLE 1280]MBF1372688.1 MFS transporter [Porphyromonadaceae bacterium]MBF1381995.1 MFS transporter [Porphyromonas sp.]MBF1389560.1 MFS transporter [Porphyromonas sp.]